ncbi:MAG: secondary thiamine-phosphate synthase enzyme YjbQ [bacterium]
MQRIINIKTNSQEGLYDITENVRQTVEESKIQTGLAHIYVLGATAGIMIQENWDESVQNDVISLLQKLIPHGVWEHDKQDGNGDAHLKSGIIGPSETVPVMNGKLKLSQWQNIFLCDFDGPREKRQIVVTIVRNISPESFDSE